MKRIWKLVGLACLGLSALTARADYVGELETTKYFDQTTVDLLQTRLASGSGLLAGDVISYYIQFTPTDNGGLVGGGGFVTDYIPAGTQVVGAQFVRLNGDGTYTQVAPPTPAAMLPYYVPMYSDTGIFYSTDARTGVYTAPASTVITSANGYATIGGGCKGISLPSSTHNAWDSAMVTAFSAAARVATGTCAVPPATTYNAATALNGLSPVAGPDVYLTKDSTGAVGPWQRIAYPGSYLGTRLGVASYGGANKCIGGVQTSAGYNLSSSNPLPPNTTAVRFAAGKVTVGELFSVRISLKLTANMPVGGIINNTEVFGGDASLDPGSAAGKDNHWKYHCPAVAISNSNLLLVKTLVGACAGVGCVPTAVTAGVVPALANLKLRYNIQYLNLGGTPQTNLILKDTLATGGAYAAGSYVALSGTGPGAPTASATAPVVLTFPTIPSLASGAGGKIQYDVNFAVAPTAKAALINTANLVSTEVPAPGVTSKSIATASTAANLWIGKSTTTSSVTSNGTVSYTISIPNNGGTAVTASAAKPITVNEYLPTSGLGITAADRFSYALGSVVAQTWTGAGVATAVTPVVTVTAPAMATAREQVAFVLNAGTIPVGGKLTLTFNAVVGGNVPASATPYLNNANVWYSARAAAAANSSMSETIGVAPVTVTAPMTVAVKVDCVYAGTTCVPYANGSIPPGAKIKYRVDYKNISAATLSGMVLTDTLPANVTYVLGSAQRGGVAITDPTVGGQVLTFSATSLVSNATGYVTFDAQLGAAIVHGNDITNTVKLTASTFAAGVTANVTSSIRDQAELTVTKTVSPSTVASGGTVTYTVTVTNIGSVRASNIKVYDLLPYAGTTADPTNRFNYTAAGTFTLNDTLTPAGKKITAVTPTTSVPPTFTGYTAQSNRQQVLWDFAMAGAHANDYLSPGQSFTFTYTATAGSALASSATPYTSDVVVEYISATTPPSAVTQDFAYATAPVTIGGLDHIQITHDGSGLTCAPATVTLTACANASCTAPHFAGGVSNITLSPGGQVFSIGSAGINTAATVAQTTAGSVTLSLSGASPTPTNAHTCWDSGSSSASCTMTFADTGFILSDAASIDAAVAAVPSTTDGAEVTVPAQVAGVGSAQYVLRAVKKGTTNKACEAALTGAQTVNFAYECKDPATCASGNRLTVNGTKVQANNNGATLGYTGVNLTFDANGNALTTPLTLNYDDVGQVMLHFQKTVNGKSMLGNSNAFVVKPHHFAVDVCGAATIGDCTLLTPATPTSGAGTVLAVAGTNAVAQPEAAFKATVRAMTAIGNVAVSYGSAVGGNDGSGNPRNTSEAVTLTHNCTAPLVAGACPSAGSLNGSKTLVRNTFASGVASVSDLTWSEVGTLTLTAQDSLFMGISSAATGTSANAGRFRPHHFDTSAVGPMGCDTNAGCASPVATMAYSGQGFNVQVSAKNAADSLTQNYQGGFAKPLSLSAVTANGGASISTTAPGGTLTTDNFVAADFSSGSTPTARAQTFTFATEPSVPLSVFIRAIENGGDGVTSLRTTSADSIEGGVRIVSGQIKIGNAYGSELLPLTLTAKARYYSSAGWVDSLTDSVTALSFSKSGITVTGVPVSATLSGGKVNMTLNSNKVSGSVTITPVAPSYFPVTAGLATFGVFKGKNEFIYLRESY